MKLKPIQIGPLEIECPVVLAPMTGVTDMPFRTLVRRFGSGLNVTEMIASQAMITGTFSLTPSTVVIVFMKLPNQDGYAARFMPLKPKGEQGEKAPSHADDAGPHHHHHSPKH